MKSGLHLGRMQMTKQADRVARSVALPVLSYLILLRLYGYEEPRVKDFSLFRLKERFVEEVYAHEASRLEFRWKRKLNKLRCVA